MFDSDSNDLEGTDDIKTAVEETILSHCWRRTDVCPSCGCESTLLIGVETETDAPIAVPDCSLCDLVARTVATDIDYA